MRRLTIAFTVCVVALSLATAARAAEKNYGAGLKIGYHNFVRYNTTDDPDGDGVLEDGEIDRSIDSGAFDGFTIEGDFEYRFYPNFVLGAGLQWYGGAVDVNATADGGRAVGDISLDVIGITVTPRFVLPVGLARLYTGAGLGLYWRTLNSNWTITDRVGNETTENNADSQAAVGYHAMLGVEFMVRNWIGIVLEDRFAFVHFKGYDSETDVDDNDAGGNSLFVGTRFHF